VCFTARKHAKNATKQLKRLCLRGALNRLAMQCHSKPSYSQSSRPGFARPIEKPCFTERPVHDSRPALPDASAMRCDAMFVFRLFCLSLFLCCVPWLCRAQCDAIRRRRRSSRSGSGGRFSSRTTRASSPSTTRRGRPGCGTRSRRGPIERIGFVLHCANGFRLRRTKTQKDDSMPPNLPKPGGLRLIFVKKQFSGRDKDLCDSE
jgi:hypothetical protein